MKYLLVDTLNLFFRIRHTAHRGATLNDKLGLSMHMLMAAANKVAQREGTDHVIFALEGENNWRKDFYPPYKKQRADERQKRTQDEIDEDRLYFEVFSDYINYINSHTNCSVIKCENAEADDIIARFIKMHPDDYHTILSSDSDFRQLINDKVAIYNGVEKQLWTHLGVFGDNAQPVVDKKTGYAKMPEDPEWYLFKKCIRGDKTDNVFSAFPGVREKGTKNKTGLLEAFDDRNKKGFNWNNVMLQRWVDHEEKEHRVLDDYTRNRILIDLDAQPQEVKDAVDTAILDELLVNNLKMIPASTVNFQFMKFCGAHDLQALLDTSHSMVRWLAKPYSGLVLDLSNVKEAEIWND